MSLHPLLVEGLKEFIRAAPPGELREFAEATPAFSTGGFRAGNTEKLRARMETVLARMLEDAPDAERARVLDELQPEDHLSLVEMFSEAVVLDFPDELAALMGAGPFAFACWVDERDDVRELIRERLNEDPVFEPVGPVEAAWGMVESMGARQVARLAEAFQKKGADTNADAPAETETGREESRKLREEISRLHEENRRLKGSDDRAARQRERADKAEAALSAALATQRGLESETRRLTREREEARAELARETKFRDSRLSALHEAEMAQTFEGWLGRAQEVELEIQKDCDPLARAEAALKHQADSERHGGNRATLLARREAVEQTRGRVAAALADALRPSAALLASARDLGDEARRLDALLETQNLPATAFENAVALHAHKADENALYHLSTLLDRMAEISALDPAALGRLRAVLARRKAFLHATAGDPANVGAAAGPVAVLRRALLCEKGAVLLVDGHNIFFALQGKYAAPAGPVVPDREKRARFVADVTRVAHARPTCRAWVVFDGPYPCEESPAPNVRVVYSGGAGEHRADKIVADTARFLRQSEPGVPVIVATNDNALRGEVQKIGALAMTAAELGQFL